MFMKASPRWVVLIIVLLSQLFFDLSVCFSQSNESDLRIFGYFQSSFQHFTDRHIRSTHPNIFIGGDEPAQNSFSVQQLNLFFQKDLAPNWRAFVNFEFLNNFSSSRRWGSANLEEAWVRYRSSEKFNLKLGLLIPVFNNLNEIKNRTPLLPYIIRPIIYETSFGEVIPIDEYVPARAFVQTYGFFPKGEIKLEYAGYIGNSPNISSQDLTRIDTQYPTGLDTTDTFLLGGRVGIRYKELKVGFSTTHENVNMRNVPTRGEPQYSFTEIPRIRLGMDLSFHVGSLSFEGEYVSVTYDDDSREININKEFYYGTIGYHINEQLFTYFSYIFERERYPFNASLDPDHPIITDANVKLIGPTAGLSYHLNDRLTFKGQYALIESRAVMPMLRRERFVVEEEFSVYAVAASVFF